MGPLPDRLLSELTAHRTLALLNALHEKPHPYGAGICEHGLRVRQKQADRLARATGLDMVQAGWRPTAVNYLGKVTKARILEAVREGAGAQSAQLLDHMKKADMAKEAERMLADTGWLPEPLRLADAQDQSLVETDPANEGSVELPAFLSGDDEDENTSDLEDEAAMIAAE